MKLPDPLLVRYFRAREIEAITTVERDPHTHEITVTLPDRVDAWTLLADIGWIPKQ